MTHLRSLLRPSLDLGPSLLLLMLAAGCSLHTHHYSSSFSNRVETVNSSGWPEAHQMVFHYETREGHAALTTERAVLVFHGLSAAQQQVFHFQGKQQAVQVAGPGRSSVCTTCANGKATVTFRSEYSEGTNTLQFGEQVVRLACEGRLLLLGDESVNLGEGCKVIHLKRDKLVQE